MTEEQIQALQPAFAAYLDRFLFCCGDTRTFDHLHTYCRGLLSDLPRKSVEPIALAAGLAVRSLQLFLTQHVWNQRQALDLLQHHVAILLPTLPADDLGTVGLFDDTATVKKGTRTPGVQRQWCGTLGKVENCVVTVHFGVCRGTYKTLFDGDLYLPQSWADDRTRCREAAIPDTLVYRPKWRIALRHLLRALAVGVTLDWLTFDEGYGGQPELLVGIDALKVRYVGEVKKSFSCREQGPAAGAGPGVRADALVEQSAVFRDQPWRAVRLRRQTLADQVWEVKAGRVWMMVDGRTHERPVWLIVARNVATGEVKYLISNADAAVPVATLLRVAFVRWNVEHAFRVSKTEIGFSHYEGRHYGGLRRHLVLCLLVLGFVAEQAVRLRGEKPGGDAGASEPGAEPVQPGLVGGAAWDGPVSPHGRGHSVSPAA
jgi:SRSO17 transposase